MTLISALSGYEGVLLFADTQETVADYSKKAIEKTEIWDIPGHPFRFAIAGATDSGTYADLLQNEIVSALGSLKTFDTGIITEALTATLTNFYSTHVWPRPAGERPETQFLLIVQPLPNGFPQVFHIAQTAPNILSTEVR